MRGTVLVATLLLDHMAKNRSHWTEKEPGGFQPQAAQIDIFKESNTNIFQAFSEFSQIGCMNINSKCLKASWKLFHTTKYVHLLI